MTGRFAWTKVVLLVGCCAVLPLLGPQAWTQHGAFPHVAAIAVIYAAFAVGPDAAALLGVAIGIAGTPFTAEPLGQQAFLLGAAGYAAGRLCGTFHRERTTTQIAFVAVTVLVVRLAEAAAAHVALRGALSATPLSGWPLGALPAGVENEEALHVFAGAHLGPVVSGAVLCAVGSAVVAPVAFSLLSGSGLLRSFERRSARRV